MTRLDIFVAQKLQISRTKASELISSGCVYINGNVTVKSSALISENDSVECVTASSKYVSRGGLKLEAALNAFEIYVSGLTCVDFGASTGGFTDCLLQNGAKKVYAIDGGQGQLCEALLKDNRVVSLEKTNAKNVSKETIGELADFACVDVSFISVAKIITNVLSVLKQGSTFVVLIKPQFEVGKGNTKGGIVKDKRLREKTIKEVCRFIEESGAKHFGIIESPIAGGDGNIEYLSAFVKNGE